MPDRAADVKGTCVVAVALASLIAACNGEPVEGHRAVWRLQESGGNSATSFPIGVLGGGCHADKEEVSHVDVDESDSRVIIAAFIREPPTPAQQPCPAIGMEHSVTVELTRPLGDRELIDPACEQIQNDTYCEGGSKRPDGDA